MAQLFAVAIAGVLAWGLWAAMRPSVLFRIDIRDGSACNTKGKVSGSFVDEVREVARDHSVSAGVVEGYLHRGRTRLRFSRHIPGVVQQRLRNLWVNFH